MLSFHSIKVNSSPLFTPLMFPEDLAKEAQNCRACPDIKRWASSIFRSAFKRNTNPQLECPPSAEDIGSSTWTFLHSMSVYFPETPSQKQQQDMQQFMNLFSEFYPCKPCAENLKDHIAHHPPETKSREEFSRWMCELHNEVNERLGKPYFDCSKVMERWRSGCGEKS